MERKPEPPRFNMRIANFTCSVDALKKARSYAPGSVEEIRTIMNAAIVCALAGGKRNVTSHEVKLAWRYCGH